MLCAVVLDMDGLMLDTERLYKVAWQQASQELGFLLDDEMYLTLLGRPGDECEVDLVVRFGDEFPMRQFRARRRALWQKLVEDKGIPHKPGLFALLNLLRAHRLPVAIATSSNAERTEFSLRKAGLGERFEVVVTRDQVARGKPDPALYVEAARRLGQRPVDCMAIEDSDAGVLAACAAGMTTVCVPDLKPPSEAVRRLARCVVGSLNEVHELLVAMLTGRSAG